jgi:hypothetical protein
MTDCKQTQPLNGGRDAGDRYPGRHLRNDSRNNQTLQTFDSQEVMTMKLHSTLTALAILLSLPAIGGAQEKKVVCADNTIVTSVAACDTHGGKQKAGGLNRIGKQINKAAIDTKDEIKRTPDNVSAAAKTTGHNVKEAAGDVSSGAGKTAKKARHGAGEAAGDVSKTAQKVVHPTQYTASCNDGTTYKGRSKKNACKNHGGVSSWTNPTP